MSPIRSGAKLKRGETVRPRWKFAVGQAEKGCLRESEKMKIHERSLESWGGLVRENIFSNRLVPGLEACWRRFGEEIFEILNLFS